MQFSNDFLWGAASASYQIEGAYLEDGKGENIWDAYCQESGHVAHGENGNVACDHYHRFREDVKMMQKMGIKNYRFSISWTRILPDGTGAVNQKGIQFYSDLVDALLEAAITPKTKALILCSPSNPTGSVYTKEELAGLSAVLAKHPQVIVIADEIYEHINYIGAHQSIAQFPEMKERTVIVNGVSKAYAMTGWRIGFIAGPEWIVKACNKLQGQYTSGPCSVSQKAAEAAYTGTQEPVKEMQKAFERRRDLIVKLAKEVPGFEVNVPQGAFYLFPKCDTFFGKSNGERKIADSDDLAMYLLEEAHVACVGGASFGAPECIRMSYATSDENIVEAIRRIKEALAKLK